MPITQTRLINLLDEAERLTANHFALIKKMTNLLAKLDTIGDMRLVRDIMLAEIEMHDMTHRCPNMEYERRHFNSVGKRNDRNRIKMEKKRRAMGVPQYDSPEYRANARRYYEERGYERDYDKWNAEGADKRINEPQRISTDKDIFKPTQEEMEKEAQEGTITNSDLEGL
jgi:hypothetical protein